jgi:hypothetical protein
MITAMANNGAEQHHGGQQQQVGDAIINYHVARVGSSDNSRCQKSAKVGDKTSRRVRFTRNGNISYSGSALEEDVSIVFHATEPMTEEEFSSYFIQSDDMQRFNKDMEETIRKYVDYRLGKASFDLDSWTIRGLEEILDHMKCNTKNVNKRRDSRVDIKAQHKQEVLAEVRRQQQQQQMAAVNGKKKAPLDVEQVRQVSLRLSENDANRAALMARRDREDVRSIYGAPESSSSSHQVCCSEGDEIVITMTEDCQKALQVSAKQVGLLSEASCSRCSESNCLREEEEEENKTNSNTKSSGRVGGRPVRGRWALSFSRKKKGDGLGLE